MAKRAAGPEAHAAEAAGLRWLAEPGVVPLPAVHAQDARWLVLDYVPGARPTAAAAREFGAGLAELHLAGAPAFGAAPPGGPVEAWIGLARMPNLPEDTWAEFYARHRIEPYLRDARDQGLFSPESVRIFETVCAELPDLAGPAEPPARCHGDTWSGNVHWSAPDGRVWLLDPAAHGGHRETDLAMLALFAAPHLEEILEAYTDATVAHGSPLTAGWRERTGVHQLFPLLVHTVLFGGGYAQAAVRAAQQALALR